jgi:hypothetical protein
MSNAYLDISNVSIDFPTRNGAFRPIIAITPVT